MRILAIRGITPSAVLCRHIFFSGYWRLPRGPGVCRAFFRFVSLPPKRLLQVALNTCRNRRYHMADVRSERFPRRRISKSLIGNLDPELIPQIRIADRRFSQFQSKLSLPKSEIQSCPSRMSGRPSAASDLMQLDKPSLSASSIINCRDIGDPPIPVSDNRECRREADSPAAWLHHAPSVVFVHIAPDRRIETPSSMDEAAMLSVHGYPRGWTI